MQPIEKTASAIRLTVTAIVIAEYGLYKILDGTKQDLKVRVRNAISSCKRVQDWFISHHKANPETSKIFKEQFLADEIVLLSELLETCFGLKAEGIEEVIAAIKANFKEV